MRTLLRLPTFEGPAFRLPVVVDRGAEWWARGSPRRRQLVRATALALVVAFAAWPRPHAWGEQRTVVVAARDLGAGEVLDADAVTATAWPLTLAPPGSLREIGAAVGQVLSRPVAAGHALDLAALGTRSPADLAPTGWVAIPVAAEVLPSLQPGTVLDIHSGGGGSVTGAMVLDVVGDLVWLGLPREQGAVLAAALAWGEVVVALWDTPRASSQP